MPETTWLGWTPFGLAAALSWSVWFVRRVLSHHRYSEIINDFRCTTSLVVPVYREDPDVLIPVTLAPGRVHGIAPNARQRVVRMVMSLVQDARARSELAITLPVVGAKLKDQPVGHRLSLRVTRP